MDRLRIAKEFKTFNKSTFNLLRPDRTTSDKMRVLLVSIFCDSINRFIQLKPDTRAATEEVETARVHQHWAIDLWLHRVERRRDNMSKVKSNSSAG